jgi:hypothetical protein
MEEDILNANTKREGKTGKCILWLSYLGFAFAASAGFTV